MKLPQLMIDYWYIAAVVIVLLSFILFSLGKLVYVNFKYGPPPNSPKDWEKFSVGAAIENKLSQKAIELRSLSVRGEWRLEVIVSETGIIKRVSKSFISAENPMLNRTIVDRRMVDYN